MNHKTIMSISKARIKYIKSLEQKKHRHEQQRFVAEGDKVVAELMRHHTPVIVAARHEWLTENGARLKPETEICEVTAEELQRVSFQKHPQNVLAVFPMFGKDCFPHDGQSGMTDENELYIALDGVQDPGNLGTIIRIADWFGIRNIFCSRDTADVWNPKVVQATMGSIARVNVCYGSLEQLIDALPDGFPVYGTLLDGDDMTKMKLDNRGLIVMGNEGNGISDSIAARVTHRIRIPNYPEQQETAESLNVAIATAITVFALRR